MTDENAAALADAAYSLADALAELTEWASQIADVVRTTGGEAHIQEAHSCIREAERILEALNERLTSK